MAAVAVGLSFSVCADALVVGNVPSVVPATNVNPVNYAGWTQGDPGWNNVTASGSNNVYLGDGWVLSARHVGYSSTSGVMLQTYLPNGTPGPVKSFYRIPGTYYFDYGYGSTNVNTRQYAVSNQNTIQSETGQSISLAASNGTYFTDLQLFRISEDPGLPSLTIASQPLPSDFTRSSAPEVVAIGAGRDRQSAETHWNVTVNSSTDWTWTTTTGAGNYQGYLRTSGSAKRFGTNRLTDPRPNGPGDPSDPGAINYSGIFDGVVSDTRAVLSLTTSDGITRDLVSLMTVYDRQTEPGAEPLEFQGVSGNSGSGVFYNRNGQWELAGIVHAIFRYEDQPSNSAAVYGNSTLISDLSYYNQSYPGSIRSIIDSHPNYSLVGDVNLDGVVSGTGSGSWATDDLTAFVAGWRYNNGTGQGTLTSWRSGDLNRDGKTNVHDFLLIRAAFNGVLPAAMVDTLFGSAGEPGFNGGVPEPSAVVLAIAAAALLTLGARRRNSRRLLQSAVG